MILEPTKYFSCFDRKKERLVLGTFFLVVNIVNFVGSLIILFATHIFVDAFHEICKDNVQSYERCIPLIKQTVYGFLGVNMAESVIYILFSSLLINGMKKQNTRLTMPFMITFLILTIIQAVISLVLLILLFVGGVVLQGFLLLPIIGASLALETFFLLILRAHYLEMKQSKGQAHQLLVEAPYNEEVKKPLTAK